MATGHTDLSNGDALWVKHNLPELEELPHPRSEWEFRDVDDLDVSTLHCLRKKGLVDRLNREVGSSRYTYQTTQETFEAIQHFAEKKEESDGFLPCGHSGFINRGDKLDCKTCDAEHDKAEVSA